MPQIGSAEAPLRVAIIGSGPSGFYAAEHLLKQTNLALEVDMYDRLPTPFGLVRGGVAPDHPKIKSVTKLYDKIASHSNFRFYGYVEFGKDISHAEFKSHYHQIVYAVGAQSDRHMNIPGEGLPGSHPATEFVGWYNAHPDFHTLQFDLSQEAAAVIGVGNVAMDVARILASSYEELRRTDIASYALEALRHSQVKDIYILGRRGPAQAAFTNPELKELGEMEDADIVVSQEDAALDPLSASYLNQHPDSAVEKNLQTLQEYAHRPLSGKPKRIHMLFLASPVELTGRGCVEEMKIVRNELHISEDGSLRPRATQRYETLRVGLVFRSVGYSGVPLPDVPFDTSKAVIPNIEGRVIDPQSQKPLPGEYVVGWIKRGPTGIIGTNKPDSVETAAKMLEDIPSLAPLDPSLASREAMEALIRGRKPHYVSYGDWQIIDQLEIERGQAVNRPRVKFSTVEEMLNVLKAAKTSTTL